MQSRLKLRVRLRRRRRIIVTQHQERFDALVTIVQLTDERLGCPIEIIGAKEQLDRRSGVVPLMLSCIGEVLLRSIFLPKFQPSTAPNHSHHHQAIGTGMSSVCTEVRYHGKSFGGMTKEKMPISQIQGLADIK